MQIKMIGILSKTHKKSLNKPPMRSVAHKERVISEVK